MRITVDPLSDPEAQVTVYLKLPSETTYREVLREPLPDNPPPTFKFGFSASTGGSTNIHEIRTLVVDSILPLPRLKLEQVERRPVRDRRQRHVHADGRRPSTGVGVGPVSVAGDGHRHASPPARSPRLPSGTGWDCSATATGSSALSCTRPAPIADGTTLPPISVPVAWDDRPPGATSTSPRSTRSTTRTPPSRARRAIRTSCCRLGADDSATTRVGRPVSLPLLENDRGSLDPTTVRVGEPAHGFAHWNAETQRLYYIPHPGFSGIERFTYTVRDRAGNGSGRP